MSIQSQYGSVSQRLKPPLVMQSPPTRTDTREDSSLTEPYCIQSYVRPWEGKAVRHIPKLAVGQYDIYDFSLSA